MQPLEPQSSQLGSLPLIPDASVASTKRQHSASDTSRSGSENQRSLSGTSRSAFQHQYFASDTSRSGSENQRSVFGSSSSAARQKRSASDFTQTGSSRTPSSTLDTFTAVRTGDSLFRDILISLLLYLLLTEWLRPLPTLADISEIYRIQPFLIVFALCIALDCFRVPYAWGWAAKSIIILLFIGFMFEPEGFLNGSWVVDLIRLIVQDVGHVFAARFDLISGETRTLLFLFGWALLISVVQALMLQRQHSLWFVGATLLYLVCLQLALGADTVKGIFRTLGYGLMLLSLLNLSRIQQTYGLTKVSSGGALLWLTASLAVVSILAGTGWYSASQAAPTSLMRPVSWANLTDRIFELYNEDTGLSAAAAKSGYGHDDSSLGGPLQSDSSPVFTAKTPELTYWRGESKSLYDGKGWTSTEQIGEPFVSNNHSTSGTVITQEVLWNSKSPG
ncbi:MAG TPA: transglutaminaseTgpA domain-containing protein, partial [Bryobacteraceae bacterium]